MKTLPTLILTLVVSGSIQAGIKYESVHDETYWFPNEELSMDGFQIGTVRSNLVWGDRMSVFLEKADCSKEPILFMTLSTANLKEDYPDFDFSSFPIDTQSCEFVQSLPPDEMCFLVLLAPVLHEHEVAFEEFKRSNVQTFKTKIGPQKMSS